jgi:ribosomal protein S18 acetylase RimI-like enzyme
MAVRAAEGAANTGLLRPFEFARDLDDLATLVEVAFHEELALTQSTIVRDMRQTALLGPLLWVAGGLLAPFGGLVWIEDDRLVGNISLSQDSQHPETWMVSNVAVLPEYRGRGIAGRLLDEALALMRRRQARKVLLQVRAANEAALALYRRRGFNTYDTLHECDLPSASWPVMLGAAGTAPLRGVRLGDGARLYDLLAHSSPREVLLHRPLQREMFARNLRWVARGILGLAAQGQQRIELVGALPTGAAAAYGSLLLKLGHGPYDLSLAVAPEQRGLWEGPLLGALLERGRLWPRQHVRAYVSATHPEALQALARAGFLTLRRLDQMALLLS